MSRRKGRLPGRFVGAHMRKHPSDRSQYVDVKAYQEHVMPEPVEKIDTPSQGELELAPDED